MENNYVPEIYVGENGNWFVNGYDTGTKAQGEPGKDGITPHIGADGFWYIGETNTGVRASGNDGVTPHIGADNSWYIGEKNTGVKAQGEAGPKGDKGADGAQGIRGEKGEAGAKGDVGETGPAGPKGDKGDPGTPGEKGDRGEKGENGAQGIQGVAGPQGLTGATGPQGLTGSQGPTGATGPKGDQGATGPQGPQGCQGPKGDKGEQGIPGIQGIQGPQGIPGPVNIANNLTTTEEGYALDARQGKILNSKLDISVAEIGKWGSPWELSQNYINIGSSLPAKNNEFYTTVSGANASITVKKSGFYLVEFSGRYVGGKGVGSYSNVAWVEIYINGKPCKTSATVAYSIFSTYLECTTLIQINAGAVITAKISQSGTGIGVLRSDGVDLLKISKVR